MGTWGSLCAMVLLLGLDAASSAPTPDLLCLNDYVNTITCTWHGSARAPAANCSISGVKKTWTKGERLITRSCRLEQHGNCPPGCSFSFENTAFNRYGRIPSIRMECDGTLVENLTDYRPRNHIKMNPPGAPVVNTTANHTWISWSAGAWSKLTSFKFHVQIKQHNQLWEEAYNLSSLELKLKVISSIMTGLYETRVRVQPIKPPSEHWSNWSPTTSWFGATETESLKRFSNDKVPEFPDQMTLVMGLGFCAGIVGAIILGLYTGCLRKRVYKKRQVPNPSTYFCTIQSLYEGNVKAWLNPAGAFFTTQAIDSISSVEVCNTGSAKVSSTPSVLPAAPMQSGGSSSSSSSSFSNMGYFLSGSSGGSALKARIPGYFRYLDEGDSGKVNIGISLCSSSGSTRSYKSLGQEPQSPDSGFSFGKEEGTEKEDAEDPEDQICPLLVLPLWHPSPRPPSPLRPPSPADPPLDPDDSGSVCRSSSMNAEPCRTGYLTLKELHMTFSNKSI